MVKQKVRWMVKRKAKELSTTRTVTYLKECSRMTKLTDSALTLTKVGRPMKEIGSMTSKKEMESKLCRMVVSIKANSITV